MSGAAIATVVASAASSAIQADAASSAAKKQGAAADKAAAELKAAGGQANRITQEQYAQALKLLEQGYTGAQGGLSTYSALGPQAISELQGYLGLASPKPEKQIYSGQLYTDLKGGNYRGLVVPEGVSLSLFQKYADQADIEHQQRFGGTSIFDKRSGLWSDPAGYTNTFAIQAKQEQIKNEQENAVKEQARLDAEYKTQLADWEKSEARRAEMQKSGEFGQLLRTFNAEDYSKDPTTGGAPPPNLSKTFDQDKYLANAGLSQADLIRPFDQTQYLADAGLTQADLIRKFKINEYLAKAGLTQADLIRNFSEADFKTDPGYEFRKQQGEMGVERSAAARGGQLSGATLKALNKYGQNIAAEEYQNAFNRFITGQNQAQSGVNQAQNRYLAGQANAQSGLNNALTRYQSGQNLAQAGLNQAQNRFTGTQAAQAAQYGDVYNRYIGQNANKYSMLSGLLGTGQQSATQQSQLLADLASKQAGYTSQLGDVQSRNLLAGAGAQADLSLQQGNIQAANIIGQGNALTGAIGGVNRAFQDYAASRNSSYQQPSYMQVNQSYNGWGL